MSTHKLHVMPHRRKREHKTDYKARLNIIKSKKHRFAVRKSLKHMVVQVIDYSPRGDKVIFTASSEHIKKLGWKHSTSNLPASYLVGLYAGKKAKSMKIIEGVLDLGLQPSIKGSRIYAALKGIIDAGIKIPSSEKIFPSEERLAGKHIAGYRKNTIDKDMETIKNKIMA